MSDEKNFELTDKELDGVAGGYMVATYGDFAVAAGTSKKTGKEDSQMFIGPDAARQADEYAEKNLILYKD